MVNPWVRTPEGLARTQVKHYYASRLRDPAFWRKLFSGRVAWGAFGGLFGNIKASTTLSASTAEAAYTDRMAQAWAAFDGPVLLALSDTDYTAREFELHASASAAWQRALTTRPPTRHVLRDADHTCSQPHAMAALTACTLGWLQQHVCAPETCNFGQQPGPRRPDAIASR